MKRKGKCVFCFNPVRSGGDRHKGAGTPVSSCPRRPGVYGEHRRGLAQRRRKTAEEALPQRGVAVANTGGSKAKTHRQKKAKANEAE